MMCLPSVSVLIAVFASFVTGSSYYFFHFQPRNEIIQRPLPRTSREQSRSVSFLPPQVRLSAPWRKDHSDKRHASWRERIFVSLARAIPRRPCVCHLAERRSGERWKMRVRIRALKVSYVFCVSSLSVSLSWCYYCLSVCLFVTVSHRLFVFFTVYPPACLSLCFLSISMTYLFTSSGVLC